MRWRELRRPVFYLAWELQQPIQNVYAHDEVSTRSVGTTEEVFFSNWDFGGILGEKTMLVQKPTRL
jgi:hypothetical protein